MHNRNKNSTTSNPSVIEEPAVKYFVEKKASDNTEFHPVLIQLLEKSIKEAQDGKGSTTQEVMQRVKEKYPFLK